MPSILQAMKSYSSIVSRAARPAVFLLAVSALTSAPVRADVVFAWNEALLQFSTATSGALRPHLETRAYAIAHLAMQEALRTVPEDRPATPEAKLATQRAAVVVAAHDVLVTLLPAGRAMFDALEARHLAAIPAGEPRESGRRTGQAAAARLLQARGADGWSDLAWFEPVPDVSESAAAAAMRGERAPASPWLRARPFGLKSAGQIEVRELRTVKSDGEIEIDPTLQHPRLFDGLDAAEVMTARDGFWGASPLVAWNRVARQATVGRVLDLPAQASLLAALNVALADGTLSAAHWRYEVGCWRSVGAEMWVAVAASEVRSTDVVVRVDGGWFDNLVRREPHRIVVPPTPNHPSLAATVAGAAQATLERWFGTDAIRFTVPMNAPTAKTDGEVIPSRSFGTFSAAARESAFAATLDGRTNRESSVAGYLHGKAVGKYLAGRSGVSRR